MATLVNLQALPEDHELVQWARNDPEVAELLQYMLSSVIKRGYSRPSQIATDKSLKFDEIVQSLIKNYPLISSLDYSGNGHHPKVSYLLSSKRLKLMHPQIKDSLIKNAIYGEQRLDPENSYLGFVTKQTVHKIGRMLGVVQFEDIVQLFNDDEIDKNYVYQTKTEFLGIRDLYIGASQNGYAVITDLST